VEAVRVQFAAELDRLRDRARMCSTRPIPRARQACPPCPQSVLVNKLADQIRTQIQDMIEQLLGQRRSPVLPAFLG
jgi:hypothetical protein